MSRIKRLAALLLCAALLLAGLAGCAPRATSVEYVIGVSLANLREQWRLVLKQELEAEAAKYSNVRLIFTDAAGDSDKQAADVARLMDFAIDLLIISPHDVEAMTPVIGSVYDQIPVIVLDRAVEGYEYSLFIGPDNQLIGRQAGRAVLSLLDEAGGRDGLVLELKTDSFSSQSRSQAFRQTLAEAGAGLFSLDLDEATRDCAEDLLVAHPELLDGVSVVFAHNDYMAYGVRLALQRLGREGIRIVGMDGFSGKDGGQELVQQGLIDATLVCPTGGTEAIQYALDILNKQSGIPKQVILRSHPIRAGAEPTALSSTVARWDGQRPIRVGYAQIREESDWRQANLDSIQTAARDFGIDLTIAFNDLSLETQIAQVHAFIEQGMDVIVISPVVSDGWQEVLEEARQAGIPVLLADRMVDAPEELYTAFIGADFEEEGRRCARWMMQAMDDRQQVRIMELRGTDGASPQAGRQRGFEAAIAQDSRFQIVYSESGDFNREDSRQLLRRYLAAHPWDIDVIFAHNDDMALGAIDILKEYGIRPGTDVYVLSIDGIADALDALEQGELNCVVECNPLLGPELMKAVTDLMNGKELPLRIITDEIVFTADTPAEAFRNRKY